MKILYLDTSSSFLYTAIMDEKKVIIEIKEKLDRELSTKALPKINEMFEKSNIKPNEINKIIVVNGPGSFTGIRIGLTIAKTFAWAKNIPIIPISSLEAMSLSCDEKKYKYVIPYIDARRDFAFAAIYDTENSEFVMTEKYISRATLEVIMENLPGEITYISNDQINTDYNIIGYNPNILNIVLKNYERPSVNPHAIDANYLKLTEAEEKNDNRNN